MSNGGKYIFVYDKNYAQNVTTNFQTFLENDLYIDLIFVCRNNKRVGAHQVVLGCLSKFFYSIFVDNLNTLKEKVLHIHVPDIRAKIMKYILQFIYSGKAMLNKEELEEFNEDIKLLGMPLDHFSAPSEAAENIEIPTAPNPPRKSTPRVVADTVDLTDMSINDDVMEVKGKSDNTNELPSRETPAEATIPAALPTVSADSNNTITPPLIDKNPTEKVSSAISSETENRTTSTSSSSSNATTKLPSISEPENRTTPTSSSNTSSVATSNPKSSESVYRTPTISNCSSIMTMVPENKRNIVKPETTVPQVPENNPKKPPNVDLKRQRSKNAPPPSKRTRYLSASIDLDASDDDDVITLS